MILVTGWQVENSSNSNGVGGKMEGHLSPEDFHLWVGSYSLSWLVENKDMTHRVNAPLFITALHTTNKLFPLLGIFTLRELNIRGGRTRREAAARAIMQDFRFALRPVKALPAWTLTGGGY